MKHIQSTDTQAFVNYTIHPIPAVFKQSLKEHLHEHIVNYRGDPEEYIYVLHDCEPESIAIIRYQFGEYFNEDMRVEVAELIEQELGSWLMQHNIAEAKKQ